MLSDATNMEELDKASTFAKHLSETDKQEARALYKLKYSQFMNAIKEGIKPDDKREVSDK